MIQVNIFNLSGIKTHTGNFETVEKAEEWIKKNEISKTFGKQERTVRKKIEKDGKFIFLEEMYSDIDIIKESFKEVMSNPIARPLLNKVLIDFDVTAKSVASARPGSPASIVINPNIIKEIFNNIPTEMQGSAINFIIGHEIGHLIVESVRTNEIGSFEKANTEEFYGKVKHHQLVDAVGMNLANLSWEETLKILKYFPNEGDFSDRIYCLEHL